ncbi:hypothetical protein ACQJBY_072871 [Aegilops geniculata]
MSTHTDNILDVEPWAISFPFLRDTTNDFSEERVIGQGGYGIVYKGVHRDGPAIAVRKLYSIREIDDEQLQKEFTGLKMLNHPNIVRLLGYCYEQEQFLIPYKEKNIFAPRKIRLLCFEYMKNGSLDQYIKDASSGLSWHGRYQIIKGISEGLRYLHEGLQTPIIHMNLKPSNILLDHNMMPKIADFGLRRLVGEGNARCMGTIAYMSPEFIERQVISHKCDIYSLGVIIIKLITGERLYSGHFDMSSDRFIELAHEEWRERLQKTLNGMSLEGYSQQIKKCLEIALKCVELDRHERPSIGDIIDRLNETETLIPEEVRAVHNRIDSTHSELLEVHPQELYFPFMLRGRYEAMSSCSLQLKNRGDTRVAFMLVASNPDRYLTRKPLCGIVPPRCVYTLSLTMLQQTASTSSSDSIDFFTLYTTAVGQHDLLDVPKDVVSVEYDYFFKKAQKMPGARDKVQVATLKIICDRPDTKSAGRSPSPEVIIRSDAHQVSSIDVHPTEPWIMATNRLGHLCVWNYNTMAPLNAIGDITDEPVHMAKYIAREKWLVAGDSNGGIHVYNYDKNQHVKSFEAHESCITTLAVHRARPFILSSSSEDNDHLIKLWDWDKEWKCTRTFQGHTERVTQATFNPQDNDSFASASWDGTVKACFVFIISPVLINNI